MLRAETQTPFAIRSRDYYIYQTHRYYIIHSHFHNNNHSLLKSPNAQHDQTKQTKKRKQIRSVCTVQAMYARQVKRHKKADLLIEGDLNRCRIIL